MEITETPSATTLKEAINGGYLEHIPFFDSFDGYRAIAFCDEDGKLKALPYNYMATILWHVELDKNGVPTDDVLRGPVVIVAGDEEILAGM